MPSYGMCIRVTLLRTDVSEERTASVIRVTKIGELGTTSALCIMFQLIVTTVVPMSLIFITLMTEAVRSSETSVLT
jgi:hypothetical protein